MYCSRQRRRYCQHRIGRRIDHCPYWNGTWSAEKTRRQHCFSGWWVHLKNKSIAKNYSILQVKILFCPYIQCIRFRNLHIFIFSDFRRRWWCWTSKSRPIRPPWSNLRWLWVASYRLPLQVRQLCGLRPVLQLRAERHPFGTCGRSLSESHVTREWCSTCADWCLAWTRKFPLNYSEK